MTDFLTGTSEILFFEEETEIVVKSGCASSKRSTKALPAPEYVEEMIPIDRKGVTYDAKVFAGGDTYLIPEGAEFERVPIESVRPELAA